MHLHSIGFWKSWWRTQSIQRKRAWEQMGVTLLGLLPWQHTLRVIEGRTHLLGYHLFDTAAQSQDIKLTVDAFQASLEWVCRPILSSSGILYA